jgi:hypothetical protein
VRRIGPIAQSGAQGLWDCPPHYLETTQERAR